MYKTPKSKDIFKTHIGEPPSSAGTPAADCLGAFIEDFSEARFDGLLETGVAGIFAFFRFLFALGSYARVCAFVCVDCKTVVISSDII